MTQVDEVERVITSALDGLPRTEDHRSAAIAVLLARAWALASVTRPETRAYWATCAYQIADQLAAPAK